MTTVQRVEVLPGLSAPGTDPTLQGKEQFLQLLMAELRYQDPLKPLADREFIGQLAQLRTLEQTEQMNQTLSALVRTFTIAQASSFIGRQVEGDAVAGPASGVVSGIVVDGDEVSADVGGQLLPVSKIRRVYETLASQGEVVSSVTTI